MTPTLPTSFAATPLSLSWLLAVGLVSVRIAVVLALTPVLRSMTMPLTVRMLLVLALSVALAGVVAQPPSILPPATPQAALGNVSAAGALMLAALCELAIGLVLALGILLAFATFAVAGNLLDVQVGFGIAQIFDAASARPLPILASLFNQLAVLVFFLVDGHHALLRGLAWSLVFFPPGAAWPLAGMDQLLLGQAAGLFSLGFALAAPVAFCLLLIDLALGVIARNLPQMNLFALGIPLKIIAGLLALAAWLGGIGALMERVFGTIYQGWHQLFALLHNAASGASPALLLPLQRGS